MTSGRDESDHQQNESTAIHCELGRRKTRDVGADVRFISGARRHGGGGGGGGDTFPESQMNDVIS